MKNIITQPTVKLVNDEQPETLVQEDNVQENSHKRNFTTIDMWNRNRKVRSARSMLRSWHLN